MYFVRYFFRGNQRSRASYSEIFQDEVDNDWSVNVGASPTHMDHTVDAIVDNFIGGLKYRMNVRAVTEAGEGDISAISDAVIIEMPLLRNVLIRC